MPLDKEAIEKRLINKLSLTHIIEKDVLEETIS